jgi:hypothetical protein
MNFWQFLIVVWNALYTHGTRVLGVAVGTLTALTTTGIVPESHLKYYLAAIAILTYWRGMNNADKIADKVIAKTVDQIRGHVTELSAEANPGPFVKPPSEIPK